MKKRNGIGIFFILGIATLVTIAITKKENPRKPSPFIMDTGSTFSRNGETFDDQMAFKGPIEVNNIPLTIVTAPPEVPAEAQITLGEQRKESLLNFRVDGRKVDSYTRDIFIEHPGTITLKGFRFVGFEPTFKQKNGPDRNRTDEVMAITASLERNIYVRFNNGGMLPIKNLVLVQGDSTDPKKYTENFILTMTLRNEAITKFHSGEKEKMKFNVELNFECTKMMVKHKSIYKLALDDIFVEAFKTNSPLPYKDFFVINCGE